MSDTIDTHTPDVAPRCENGMIFFREARTWAGVLWSRRAVGAFSFGVSAAGTPDAMHSMFFCCGLCVSVTMIEIKRG
jgi:hypothetical protein